MKKFKKIYVEITNICNLNCSFCVKDNLIKQEMKLDKFEYILKQINNYTDYIYLHVKGEPLLHSDFNGILKLCTKYNKKVNITTNGTLLKKRLNDIINSNVRQINISMQSLTDLEVLNDILDSAKILLEQTNIEIVFRFWALNHNMDNFNLQIINKIITYFDLQNIKDKIMSEKNITLSKHLYLNKDVQFEWPKIKANKTNGTCYGLRTHLGILVDGTIIPCCLDSCGVVNLGNIFKETLDNIMKKERVRKMILGFQNRRIEEPLCLSCSYKNRFEEDNL